MVIVKAPHVIAFEAANLNSCTFEPRSTLEFASSFNVDEFVQTVFKVIPVELSFPPFNTTWEAKLPVVVLGLIRSSPAVIVVGPV